MLKKITFWLLLFMATYSGVNAQTSFTDDFSAGTISSNWVAGSTQYSLLQTGGELKIGVNKYEGWKSFVFNLPASLDLSANPYVNIKVRTSQDLTLNVYLVDASNVNKNIRKRISRADGFTNVCWDFTGVTGIDLTKITNLYFAVNGSALSYVGNLEFKDFKIGSVAQRLSFISGFPDQKVYQNSKKNVIYIQGMENVQNVSFATTPTLINNISFGPIIGGIMTIQYDAISGVTGTETLTLNSTGTSGYTSNSFAFQMTIDGNTAPTFSTLPVYKCKVGDLLNVQLTDVSDGNASAKQNVSFTAASDNSTVTGTTFNFLYTQDAPIGLLQFTPVAAGTANVTVTANDGQATNNITSKPFSVVAYTAWNAVPSINSINPVLVYNNAGQQTIALSGISDGDGTSQTLTFGIASSDPTIVPVPTIQYTSGTTGTLKFSPQPGKIGVVTVTVTLSDNGGNINNNGNGSITKTFTIDVQSPPLTGFIVPFTDYTGDRANRLWHVEGEPVSQTISYVKDGTDDALKISCTGKQTYGGLWYGFNKQKLDLSQNPYISMWVKSDQAILFHLYFWDYKYARNNATNTINKSIPANVWTKVVFDFYNKMTDSNGAPINADKIDSILFNYHPAFSYPFTSFTGTVMFKDIRIGDKADSTFTHAKVCTLDDIAGLTTYSNAPASSFNLTNITDGNGGIATATATAKSSNTAIVADPTVSVTANGKATLSYTLGGTTGSAIITVTVAAPGSSNMVKTFTINVQAANPTTTSAVTIDLNTKYQTMRGVGAFLDDAVKPYSSQYIDDFGASVARIGVIGNQLEPLNDNDDPYVLDRSALNYKAFDWDFYKDLQSKGVEHFILTIWSVPAWMKQNASEDYFMASAITMEATDNKVDTTMYQEYAEYAVALVKTFKEKAGIDLYGIGLQNEPGFCEPYPSAILSPAMFVKLINVVGRRFVLEGIKCRLYMAEQVLGQSQYSVDQYLQAVQQDPEAWKYTDVQAVHGYAGDGISAYTANCSQWTTLFNNVQAAPHPKEYWMTETEPASAAWSDILSNIGAMSTAFSCGNISLWTQWGYVGHYVAQGKSTQLNYAQSQFAKFAKPGSVRVSATSADNNLLINTFVNTSKYNKNLATVIINKATTPVSIKLTGANIPATFDVYQTYYLQNFNKTVGGAQKDVAYLLPAQSITTFVAPLTNAAPTIDAVADKVVNKNSGEQVITLTGITDGGDGNQTLTITPTIATGATTISNVHVDYYSPENTAKLYYTPVNNQSGNASIKIEVADNGSVNNKTSVNVNIQVLNITALDVVKDNGLKVYPNPAHGYVNVSVPDLTYKSASIVNIMGETVVRKNLNMNIEKIDINNLKNGIYFILVNGENGTLTKQFIVK